VDVFIARDGVEIGECREEDLAQLAREGQLQATDHYWREGMETWRQLRELLPPETWEAKPAAEPEVQKEEPALATASLAATQPIAIDEPPARAVSAIPFWRSRQFRIATIAFAVVLVLAIAVYFFAARGAERRARSAAFFPSAQEKPRVSDDAVRDKAVAELREKIARLPERPTAPLHTFYYDVTVNMQKSLSLRVPWTALIRGREDTVDPETNKTTVHTEFILEAEYRNGEWLFKQYHGTANDMVKEETTQIEIDPRGPVPPSVVGLLGLKVSEPE
jgi:hypothetical protein